MLNDSAALGTHWSASRKASMAETYRPSRNAATPSACLALACSSLDVGFSVAAQPEPLDAVSSARQWVAAMTNPALATAVITIVAEPRVECGLLRLSVTCFAGVGRPLTVNTPPLDRARRRYSWVLHAQVLRLWCLFAEVWDRCARAL